MRNGDERESGPAAEQRNAAQSETGVVRKLKEGFGFIAGNDGQDYFFHYTALQKSQGVEFSDLEIGDRVEFLCLEAPKGPRAIEIRRVR